MPLTKEENNKKKKTTWKYINNPWLNALILLT